MAKPLNRAKCSKCLDIIVSRNRHDYVSCSCGAIAVDGGSDYRRYVGDLDNILVFRNRKWVPLNTVLEKSKEKPNENIVAPAYDKISNYPNIGILTTIRKWFKRG